MNLNYSEVIAEQSNRITELEARIRADAQKDAWIPVSDRLPNDGESVMVYTPPLNNEDERYDFELYAEDEGGWVAHSNNYEHFMMVAKGGSGVSWAGPSETAKYTHWMPLPKPPAMQPKEQV